MTTALTGAVELLERSLGYTRVVLARVGDDDHQRSTPCRSWTLGDLLTHMEDALDVFTEAAGGSVVRRTAGPPPPQVDRIRDKACALLGTWSRPAPADVTVAGHDLATEVLVGTAALEITVHGWDVARSLGLDHPLPEPMAERLLRLAVMLVDPADRVVRFGPPLPVAPDATAGERLLAWLGRAP